MQLIRCTGKLLRELGLKEKGLRLEEPRFSFLGQWHANLIYINRQKTLLFVNDRTLFNFIIPGLSRAQIRDLPDQFRDMLACILSEEGLPNAVKERILTEYEEVGVSKSANRRVLGSSNDLAFHYKHRILNAGGIHSWRVPQIIRELNRMPMQAIPSKFPIDELRLLYGLELEPHRF
jgi:hypothetical protein